MKTLNITEILKAFVNEAGEWLFNAIVFILKPIVQFLYKKYYAIKRTVKKNHKSVRKSFARKATVAGIVFVLGIIIAFGAGQFVQNVNAHDNDILHKYYTSITVQPGDSLWSIAEEHYVLGYDNTADYIEEVMHINHLEDENEIVSGSTLVIPYYSEEIK